MKCYSAFIIITLLFQYGLVLGREIEVFDSVIPLNSDNIIKNNEVYDVLIKSEKTTDELLKHKGKKINDIMFVMEFFEKNNQRIYRVFVTDPPQPKKNLAEEEKNEVSNIFDRVAFDYRPINPKSTDDFKSYELPYELLPNKNTLLRALTFVFFTMLSFPFVWFLYRYILKMLKTRKNKKDHKLKERELMKFIEKIRDRNDFEKLYSIKDEIKLHCDIDEDEFKKLLNLINKFQYMRSWSQEQIDLLNRHLRNIIRVKSGI